MKLWTVVNVGELPHIFQNGFDNPYAAEITFDSDPEIVAESAFAERDEGAMFLEIEIPDDELEVHFAVCTGITYDMASDEAGSISAYIEDGEITDPEELEVAYARLEALQPDNIEYAADSLNLFGFVCLGTGEVIPPSMIKLLDPETMMEAMWTGDIGVVAEAVETTEAVGLESLSPSFWVWLMFLFENMFAVARGEIDVQPEWMRLAAEDKAEARRARRRQSAARRRKAAKGKKKPRKKRKGSRS